MSNKGGLCNIMSKVNKSVLFKELSVTCDDDARLLTKFYIARVALVDARHEKSTRELMDLLVPEGNARFYVTTCCCNKCFGVTMIDSGDSFNHVYAYFDDSINLCESCIDQFENELIKQCFDNNKDCNFDIHYLR